MVCFAFVRLIIQENILIVNRKLKYFLILFLVYIMVEKIRTLAKIQGTNQTKLEIELGFSQGALGKWDSHVPTVDKVARVADRLGVTIDSLVRDEKTPVSPEGNGLDERIAKLPDSFQRRLSDFLLLAQEHPDSAERFLAFAVQELQSAAQGH